jgi:hypothetical protein
MTEDKYTTQKQELSVTCYKCAIRRPDGRASIFIRHKPILSSERMLHKDCYSKVSVEKKRFLVVSLKRLDAKTN